MHSKPACAAGYFAHCDDAQIFEDECGAEFVHSKDNLSKLKQGENAVVLNITSNDGMRRRLQDIGLIKGTTVTCVQPSPLGDPVAYLIRGAVIALRSEDSSCVQIQCMEM